MPHATKEKYNAYCIQRCKRRREALFYIIGDKCLHCGATKDLEFDHIDPTRKEMEIMPNKPWAKLIREVAKCQPLCYGCHRVKHEQSVQKLHMVV